MPVSNVGVSGAFMLAVKDNAATSKPVTIENINGLNSEELATALGKFNINLSDGNAGQVKQWLKEPGSGYPALAKQILHFMNGRPPLPAGQNLTPLNNIEGKIEAQTGQPAWQVAQNNQEYEPKELQQAIFTAWQEKNSGNTRFNSADELLPLSKG